MKTAWPLKELGALADVERAAVLPKAISDEDLYLGLEDIESNSGKILNYRNAKKESLQSNKFRFSTDHILYGKLRPYLNKVALPDRPGICSTDILPIRPKVGLADRCYLAYLMRSKYFSETATERSSGANLPRISPSEIERIKIPAPSISEQKALVKILRGAEVALEKRRGAIQLFDDFLKSTFLEMFERADYPKESLGKFVADTETTDPSRKPMDKFLYVDIESIDNKEGAIKGAKKLTGAEAPSRARKLIKKGDVLVSTVRPNLNATALVPEELDGQVCSTGFAVLRCSSHLYPTYLYMCSRLNFFITQLVAKTKGASYPAVSNQDVLDTKIPFPPIREQKKFEDIFLRVQQAKQKMKSSEADLQNLFNCLMQKAFKGELFND